MKEYIEPVIIISMFQGTLVLKTSDGVFNDENELPLDEFSGLW